MFIVFFALLSVNAFAAVSISPSSPLSNADLTCGNGGAPSSYVFEWKLGTIVQQITSSSLPNTLTTPGDTVTCTMYLNRTGPKVAVGYASVAVLNSLPTATTTGPYSGIEGNAISFSGNAYDGIDSDSISSYSWNFGAGTSSNLQNPSHTYVRNGLYMTTLTARDSNEATETE